MLPRNSSPATRAGESLRNDLEFFWDDRDQPLPDIALQDVWYAGYGSNLNAERFMRYMKMQGVTAQASDFDQRRAAIPHARYFAGRASQWGVGGVAYLDLEPSLTQTPVRLWRLTYEQFAHLFYAESGATMLYSADFPWEDALEFPSTIGNFGWYGAVLNLGYAEGLPVLTATAPCPMAERNDFADPSPRYSGVINRGREQMRSLPRTCIEPFPL